MDVGILSSAVRDQFGLSGAVVTPADGEDHVFRVAHDSKTYCLKLVSETSPSRLRSQLEFMAHLRMGGLPVSEVLSSTRGEVIEAAGSIGVMSHWVEGVTLESRMDSATIRACGALVGRLHAKSSEFRPGADFQRRRWEAVYAPSGGDWLREFFHEGLLAPRAQRTVEKAVLRVHQAVQRLGGCPTAYGMLHADFHGSNLIDDGSTIHILDFDDCGWGHWLFDVAWPAALFCKAHGETEDFLRPFLQGYEQVRPLSAMESTLLPEFMAAAWVATIEMVFRSSVDQHGAVAGAWYDLAVESLAIRNP